MIASTLVLPVAIIVAVFVITALNDGSSGENGHNGIETTSSLSGDWWRDRSGLLLLHFTQVEVTL